MRPGRVYADLWCVELMVSDSECSALTGVPRLRANFGVESQQPTTLGHRRAPTMVCKVNCQQHCVKITLSFNFCFKANTQLYAIYKYLDTIVV